MTTISRKDAITSKYAKLCDDIMQIDAKCSKLLPSMDEYDIVDLVFFFRTLFPVGCNYRKELQQYATAYNIQPSDDTMEKITPLIIEYLEWFRTLL